MSRGIGIPFSGALKVGHLVFIKGSNEDAEFAMQEESVTFGNRMHDGWWECRRDAISSLYL